MIDQHCGGRSVRHSADRVGFPAAGHTRREFLGRVGAGCLAGAAWGRSHCSAAVDSALPIVPLRNPGQALQFVVLGDTHYSAPDYEVSPRLHRAAQEILERYPNVSFVCHTGDLADGGSFVTDEHGKRRYVLAGYEQMHDELTFAMNDLEAMFRRPVFVAIGNHDRHDRGGRAFQEAVLRPTSKVTGQPMGQPRYAFRCGSACFAFLDYGAKDLEEQARFLEATLTAARNGGAKRIFLFAHFPLWTVVRSGFNRAEFTESILPLIVKYKVDAFFCGHTHNAIVSVRRFGESLVTQIQGASLGKSDQLVLLKRNCSLLVPEQDSAYCWGFLEEVPMSYAVVRVNEEDVRVQWCVFGKGVVREMVWREPGQVNETYASDLTVQPRVTPDLLETAQRAWLAFRPWAEQADMIELSVNGGAPIRVPVKVNDKNYMMFWLEQQVEIPKDQLPDLQMSNRIEITNPDKAVFALAHLRIEVELTDGQRIGSQVCPDFLFSCTREDAGNRTAGWSGVPEDVSRVKETQLGMPLAAQTVAFQ